MEHRTLPTDPRTRLRTRTRVLVAGITALSMLGIAGSPVDASAARTCSSTRVLTTGKVKYGDQGYARHGMSVCRTNGNLKEVEVAVSELGNTDYAELASAYMEITVTQRKGGASVARYAFSAKQYLETSVGGQTWFVPVALQKGVRYKVSVRLRVDLARDKAGARTGSLTYNFTA